MNELPKPKRRSKHKLNLKGVVPPGRLATLTGPAGDQSKLPSLPPLQELLHEEGSITLSPEGLWHGTTAETTFAAQLSPRSRPLQEHLKGDPRAMFARLLEAHKAMNSGELPAVALTAGIIRADRLVHHPLVRTLHPHVHPGSPVPAANSAAVRLSPMSSHGEPLHRARLVVSNASSRHPDSRHQQREMQEMMHPMKPPSRSWPFDCRGIESAASQRSSHSKSSRNGTAPRGLKPREARAGMHGHVSFPNADLMKAAIPRQTPTPHHLPNRRLAASTSLPALNLHGRITDPLGHNDADGAACDANAELWRTSPAALRVGGHVPRWAMQEWAQHAEDDEEEDDESLEEEEEEEGEDEQEAQFFMTTPPRKRGGGDGLHEEGSRLADGGLGLSRSAPSLHTPKTLPLPRRRKHPMMLPGFEENATHLDGADNDVPEWMAKMAKSNAFTPPPSAGGQRLDQRRLNRISKEIAAGAHAWECDPEE